MNYTITYKLYTPQGRLRVAASQIVSQHLLPAFLRDYFTLSSNKGMDSMQILRIEL